MLVKQLSIGTFSLNILQVYASTRIDCYDTYGNGKTNSWDCAKAWSMILLQQSGCDGNAFIPSKSVTAVYGNCVGELGSHTGGHVYDSTLVGTSFEQIADDCGGLGGWAYSDGTAWGSVYQRPGSKVKRSDPESSNLFEDPATSGFPNERVNISKAVNLPRATCKQAGVTIWQGAKCIAKRIKHTVRYGTAAIAADRNRESTLNANVAADLARNSQTSTNLVSVGTSAANDGLLVSAMILEEGTTWGGFPPETFTALAEIHRLVDAEQMMNTYRFQIECYGEVNRRLNGLASLAI
jgi:hypothetical protein